MARGRAVVAAELSRLGARLQADLAGLLALARVAALDAAVPAAGDGPVAGQPAADLVHVAGHGLAELVLAVAPLLGEHAAGRTARLAVAVVKDLVATAVRPGAGLAAGRPAGAAGHGRVDHGGAALAVELVEAAAPAGLAAACRRDNFFS